MKRVIFIFISIVFIACSQDESKLPKDILPVNQMKLIVWDLVQTGSYAASLQEKDTSNKKLNTVYLTETLKLHKLTKEEFFKSFNFYQQHPTFNKVLFDSVSAYAQRQRADMYKSKY